MSATQIQDFYKATLTRNWTATTGDFNVSVAPTVAPGILVISPNSTTQREIVKYTAVGSNGYGAFVTISNVTDRGLSGTSAQSHTIGEQVRMNVTAKHWTELQDDINSIIAAGLPAGSEGDIMYHNGSNWGANNLLSENIIRAATVSLSSADILALNTTPKELLPAPGAGKINIIDEIVFSFTAGTQYTNGDQITCRYVGNTTNIIIGPIAAVINSASSSINQSTTSASITALVGTNAAFELKLLSATAFLNGTGTLKCFIKYRILTL